MFSTKIVLHPTDFSERSQAAFQLACGFVKDHGGHVLVLHVVPPGTTQLLGLVDIASHESETREALWEELRRVQTTDPGVRLEYRLEDGNPAEVICRVAAEVHADLIVMGTHGRTGLNRWAMGSVAEHVVRQAPCPCLTLKTPAAAASPLGTNPDFGVGSQAPMQTATISKGWTR